MSATSDFSPPTLDAQTLADVRATLARYAQGSEHAPELRGLLARVAAEARAKGIAAERLLIAFKEIWASLPEVRAAQRARPGEHTALLQQLVTRCIEEYYSPGP